MKIPLQKYILLNFTFFTLIFENHSEKCLPIKSNHKESYLQNAAFLAEDNVSLIQCTKLCWQYSMCASLSFSVTRLICRLNFVDAASYPDLLLDSVNWIYMDSKEIAEVRREEYNKL